MRFMRWISGVAVLVSGVTATSWMAFAEGEIGSVTHVDVWAYATPPQADQKDLFMTDRVVSDEVVRTVDGGALHLKFLDGTEMRLGSGSEMTLDNIVYDPNQGTGEFVVELGTGVFRLISGSLNSEAFKLSTPVAAIGIRGSDIEIGVADNGETTVEVNSGIATITPKIGATDLVEVPQGSSLQVALDGALSEGGAIEDPGLQSASSGRSRRDRGGGDRGGSQG